MIISYSLVLLYRRLYVPGLLLLAALLLAGPGRPAGSAAPARPEAAPAATGPPDFDAAGDLRSTTLPGVPGSNGRRSERAALAPSSPRSASPGVRVLYDALTGS